MSNSAQEYQTRNRLNQQRSRARRKSYLASLEARLHAYEREGVRVATAIQQAARHVADENAKLRALLLDRFGVQDAELSMYLASSPAAAAATAASGLTMVERERGRAGSGRRTAETALEMRARGVCRQSIANAASAQSPPPPSPRHQLHTGTTWLQSSVEDPSSTSPATPAPLQAHPDPPTPSHRSLSPQPQSPSGCCGTSNSRQQSSSTPSASSSSSTPNTTPCEVAAALIASTRVPAPAPESIWPELGCSRLRRTMVANVDVLSLMDGD